MSDARYDQYKEALRRGHVAALRGRLDAAIVAYTEAASIAPDRALPHASLGRVLLKLERPADALGAFDSALQRAPADEAALAGRADALSSLARRVDAAETLDDLARIQEAAGRLPEATDTARRALELAESRERRRHVGALAQRLRDVPADEAAAAALERALGMLEPVSAPGPSTPAGGVVEPAATSPADTSVAAPSAAAAAPEGPEAPETGEAPAETATPAEPETPTEPAVDPSVHAAEAVRLTAEAADRLDARDTAGARDALVAAAAAHRVAGNLDAALDACYLALEVAPADPELHLLLARLYVDRGWHAQANEKLRLLDRLTALSGDSAARGEVHRLVAALADAADDGEDEATTGADEQREAGRPGPVGLRT